MSHDWPALLEAAQIYLCTDARRAQGDFLDFVDHAYEAGVDIIQLRDKTLTAVEEISLLQGLRSVAQRHGRLFAVNDRADFAAAVEAPILHLGQDDLAVEMARVIVGPDVLVGRSTHTPEQFDAAMRQPGVDYVCAGPIWQTPTKPGRPGTGLALLEHAAKTAAATATDIARPWFAIGGIDSSTLDDVLDAGARRIVVVRAITEARDPVAAIEELRLRLRQATQAAR